MPHIPLNVCSKVQGILFAILIFVAGAMALYMSHSLVGSYQHLDSLYDLRVHDLQSDKGFVHELIEIDNEITVKKYLFYASVITFIFVTFINVILNAVKMRSLQMGAREHNKVMQRLQMHLVAMEYSFDGILMVDSNGCILYMNPVVTDLLGIKNKEEVTGDDWLDLFSSSSCQRMEDHILLHLRQEGSWQGEEALVTKAGEEIHVELALVMLADGAFVVIMRDASKRLQAEKEKADMQDQFFQAQKMEAIGRMAGGIAHDFNNILAAMNGYAEFLIEDLEEDSPTHGFAVNILQAGRQAKELIDQMLSFSRHKAGNIQSLDLSDSLHEVYSMLEASLPKMIDIRRHKDITGAYISGNAVQISQVLMNLCINARDAMEDQRGELAFSLRIVDAEEYASQGLLAERPLEEGGVPGIRISNLEIGRTMLTLNQVLENRRYVSLCISDTGSGMSRNVMEHIFEPFFTTKPVDKGTGLGLSTVHGVLISHNGAAIVDSTIGKGTSFELLFPLDVTSNPVREIEIESHGEADVITENIMILVVEDQEDVRSVMLNMIGRMGYEAEGCETGLEALSVLRENPGVFDLVITDHNMPKMTGMELAYQTSLENPDMPFILLSGYSEKELLDIMEENKSIYALLRKPVSREVMQHKIQSVLKQAAARKRNS